MSDYQGRIRLTLQGLEKFNQLDEYLAGAEQRAENLRQALAGINRELQGNITRRGRALQNLASTRQERLSAAQSVINVEQRRGASGRFLPGPNVNARRLARLRLAAAKIDTQNAQLELGQALKERDDLVKRGLVKRGRRLERAVPLAGDRIRTVRAKQQKVLEAARINASTAGQQIRLSSIDAQFQRRLQAFRRGGGGTNAPETIEKVFEITQAYAVQKKLISATGDLNVKVTRAQARELGNLSASLGRYNEKQLEANRLARSRVERLSGARRLGDRLRPFEIASGTARDPASGELLFPNVTRSPFPRRQVSRARQLVNRAVSAAESGDQELFRLASFQARNILDRLEAGVKAGLKNAPKSALSGAADLPGSPLFEAQQLQRAIRAGGPAERIEGRKDLVGSPAFLEEQRKEQQRQLQRAVRAGGPAERIEGRKDLVGSPAYYEEQQRQLARAVRAGGPKESLRGRKDLPGSPAFLEEQRKEQQRQLQRAIRAGGPAESIKGREDLPGSPAYYEEQRRQLQKAIRAGGPKESLRGRKDLPGSPAYYEEQQRQLARAVRAGGPKESLRGRKDLPGSPAFLEEQRKQQSQQLQRAIRAGGPAERIEGRKDLVGSPAYYEEQQRQLARAVRAGGPKESIKGRKDLPGSPAYYEEQQRQLARAVRAGGPSLPIAGAATIAGSPKQLVAAERASTVAAQQQSKIALREDRLAKLAQQGADVSQLQIRLDKAKTRVGDESVKAQEKFKRSILRLDTDIRRLFGSLAKAPKAAGGGGFFRGGLRQAIGEGLIGGAFPLLFGQGLGASIGGAAGGVSGGLMGGSFGFGLSLVGTALGTAVDNTVQGLKDLASALKSPTDAMAALEASGFRVGDSLKFQVEQLQAVGRGYDAQTLVLQEVEKRLGAGAAKELNALNAEQKKLQDSWSVLAGNLQRAVIPAVIGFNIVLNDLVQLINSVRGSRTPEENEALRNRRFDIFTGQFIAQAERNPNLNRKINPFTGRLDKPLSEKIQDAINAAPSRVPRSPQEAAAEETTRIQESRRIADQIQSAYREAFKLQRQAHDLQREGADINKEIADYSYKKEREIFDLRQQAAEKEIENNRAAAQNRIERGDLSARQTFAAATGFEQQLLTNVRESMRTRKEGEANIEQSRKRLELTMAKLNRDVEDYKRTNAREIEDIERRKLAYTRSVEDYKMQVADYVLQRSREAADLMRQAMAQGEVGGAGGGGAAPYAAVSPTQRIPFMSEIDKAAREANVDPRLFAGLVKQESAFRPGARSSSGAIGLAQLMPGTARELGVDPFNIQENLRGGARYLRQMLDRFGLEGGLRAYNQGPGAQERTPAGNSRESREYPGRVLANARAFGFNPAAMPAPATMGGAAFGRTGRMSLREGYGMVDLRGSSREAIIADAADAIVNRAAMGMRTWIGGGGGLDIEATNLRGQALTAALQQGMRAHETRGKNPATAIDLIAKLGEPLGIPVGGISDRGGPTGVAGTTARGTIALHLTPESIGRGATAMQAMAATTISNIPRPQFNQIPVGPTPSAAPSSIANEAARRAIGATEQEALEILKEGNELRQKGIELGQIEQILQSNQLPQLEQQGEALKGQLDARRQNLTLSDRDAAMADARAESTARIAQYEKDRANALAKVQKQYNGDVKLTAQVNKQADTAIKIAKGEEEQRIKNLELSNQIQNSDRARTEILSLEERLAAEKAQAAALERGELEASSVELLKASTLYRDAEEAQQRKLLALTAETEELRKQNEFRQQINQLQQERRFTGAGLRAGMIGEPARAFEEGLKRFNGDVARATQFAEETRLLEDQQLIWANLEKNIVDVSDAISGALTNGLLDIVSGAREIEDVGRDMLNGIARTFADSAQQQLSTLLQRQIAQFAGPRLAEMIGGGADAAGPQALGAASQAASGSIWSLHNAALAASATLQSLAAQAGASVALNNTASVFSGGGANILSSFFSGASPIASAFTGGIGGPAFSAGAPDILGSMFGGASGISSAFSLPFGGFLANGGTTRPGEGYIVGEEEPEFFFPGASGRVVPKSDMEKAAALAEEGADNEPIDIRYTVTEQAGERYVTEDQFRKGMAATSKRAKVMAYAGMRNSKEVRDYTGIS